MELSLGLEYESLGIEDGYWRDKDDVVDFGVFDGFSWIGLDASYVTNQPITRKVAFRIGTGLGVAVVLGNIFRTEQLCEPGEPNATRCRIDPNADRVNEPMDLPTILPILNFILGLQIQPSDDVRINIESGTRTVFYGGVTVSYFFK